MRDTAADRVFYILSAILLAILGFVIAYPLYFVVCASISDIFAVMRGETLLGPKDFSIIGYERVFSNPNILNSYRNTIIYTILGTAINIALTMSAGYALSLKFPGRRIFSFLITFTMFFGGGMIPTYFIIKNLGLIDTIWVMILPSACSAYNLIIARTFMQSNIPNELYEAAEIDGCSRLKFFFSIVLPLSTVLLAVMVLFYAVGHWNAYFNAILYLSKRELYPLQLIVREILVLSRVTNEEMKDPESQQVIAQLAEQIKYSLIIVVSLPVLVLYPFLQKYFVRGIMVGSIKG
ncbi:MAG: carbohydrate ABC transporter permease [Clostridiales bacterium]|nr:carbohydrate ABC transporter permease [Clostridiales bacterium]